MGEDMKLVIAALVVSENAMSITELVESTHLPVEKVAQALDFLVATKIFFADNSYHQSEIGEMVYAFADNQNAQELYQHFKDEQ